MGMSIWNWSFLISTFPRPTMAVPFNRFT